MKTDQMSEDDLLAFLKAESDSAYQYNSGELATERERSLKEYMRLPYGTEEEGRSQVVASDVFDSVEGMLPDLVEVFVSTDEAVRFDPVTAEDEKGAQQATDTCNYVFYKQNNGFLILYTAGKDALMMKTGGVKWYWEKKRQASFTRYRGLDEMQLAIFLMTNPKAEIVEQEERQEMREEPVTDVLGQPVVDPMTGEPATQQVPYTVYDCKVKTVEEKGSVRVVNVPPDEFLVSRRHNSILLEECPYAAHVCEKTASDIRQMGFDVSEDDVKAASDEAITVDRELRESIFSDQFNRGTPDSNDPSMVRGWLREEYVLVDFDGDGIAERRRILRLGDLILENEECSHVQMAGWTPYLLTHRFNGISVADLVSEFQKINTEILRQSLDNLALANNQESVVLTDSLGNPKANIDDLLNRRSGGVIRESVAGAVRPYSERWVGIDALPMVEMMASAKENRTGYTRYSQGLDANSLNKTATGVSMIMNASQKRMKLMARIMAEALVVPMFRGIFKTLTDYCMEPLAFRLRNEYVQYDPQEWRDGYDMTINVGIGAGDKLQQMQMLGGIEQAQAMAVGAGGMGTLVTPKNLYNLQKRKVELAGFKDVNEFWTEPPDQMPPPPPPPPDPKVVMKGQELQAQAQSDQMKLMAEAQNNQAERAFQAAENEKNRQLEIAMKELELASKAAAKAENEKPDIQALLEAAGALQMLAQNLMRPRVPVFDPEGRPIASRLANDDEMTQFQ